MNTRKSLTSLLMTMFLGALAGPATAAEIGVFGSYWDTADADEAIGFGTKLRFGIVELRGEHVDDHQALRHGAD